LERTRSDKGKGQPDRRRLTTHGRKPVKKESEGTSKDKPLVLIVEDNAPMNDFLRDLLSEEYRTESAFNGNEGLEKATRLRPDLILSDITMPEMCGDEMFVAIRSNPELATIPIVILTATSDDKLRLQLLRKGAQDYIAKPFIIEEVRSRVRNLIGVKQTLERLEREREVSARLYQEANEAVKLREEILGVVSHDLKNPLMAIRLQSQLLLRSFQRNPDPKKVEKFAATCERATRQMDRLISDLLDFAKIQSGTLALEESDQEISKMLEDGVNLIHSHAESKGVKIGIDVERNLPKVRCDSDRILQVLSNLLGNAIKFSSKDGSINLKVVARNSEILFSVADQGPGIREECLPRVFERYWQAKDTAKLGVGLGLSIARGIVTSHGGKIWVTSTVGKGATFYFTLPFEPDLTRGLSLSDASQSHRQHLNERQTHA
jgi:signal transduction histidine kinase